MGEVDVKKSGFTKFQNKDLDAIICSDLTKVGLKISLLVYRYTVGCQTEWAKIRKCEFEAAGIKPTHVGRAFESLIRSGVIDFDETNGYRLNENWMDNQIRIHPGRSSRLFSLLSSNLPRRGYQNGSSKITTEVTDLLPNRDEPSYQNGNTDVDNYRKGTSYSSIKDIFKDKKYIGDIKERITDKKRTTEEIINNPITDMEYNASTLFKRLEPNNIDSFKFYLWAVNKVDYSILYQFASEIIQDRSIDIEDRGRVFNTKVTRFISI